MRVSLNGIVAADEDVGIYEWFGFSAFSPATVRQALESTPAGEDLILEINSGGGSVMAGSEIYSVLRSSTVRTRAEIQSLAASAASYLALGCHEVYISPVAQMMIHLPATNTYGDRSEHMVSVQLLDTVRESILNAYELKSGGKADRAEFKRMMNATTWMTAQQARDLGLVDGILYEDEGQLTPQNLVNAAGAGIRALGCSAGMPDIVQLRAEYAAAHQPPAQTGAEPGADNSQAWQAQARLELEKNKFGGKSK